MNAKGGLLRCRIVLSRDTFRIRVGTLGNRSQCPRPGSGPAWDHLAAKALSRSHSSRDRARIEPWLAPGGSFELTGVQVRASSESLVNAVYRRRPNSSMRRNHWSGSGPGTTMGPSPWTSSFPPMPVATGP
jgi:hypothetical protein